MFVFLYGPESCQIRILMKKADVAIFFCIYFLKKLTFGQHFQKYLDRKWVNITLGRVQTKEKLEISVIQGAQEGECLS